MNEQTRTLLNRSLQGDEEALGVLIERERRRLIAALAVLTKGVPDRAELIEELVQDVQLHAIQHVQSFEPRGPGAFGRWLVEIGRRKTMSVLRKRRQTEPFDGSVIDGRTTPATGAVRRELHGELVTALDQLSSDHRMVILLRYFEGLDCATVASLMERSEAAVRQLFVRAMRELGQQFRGRAEEVVV